MYKYLSLLFFGPVAIRQKNGAILGHTQNQCQPFLVEIKKEIISFQKHFILLKYHQNICLG